MNQSAKPYPGTQSILRAVALLKCFDDQHVEWSLADLTRVLDLNKTTVFRYLSALESEGLVARKDAGENYVLGPEIVTMAGYALRSIDMRSSARLTLEQLAEETKETASLEIVSGDEMMIIDEVVGEHLVSGVRSLGTRWPLHGTSTGLAIVATWPPEKREFFLQSNPAPITPQTVTEPEALRALLGQFSSQGYAVSDEMLEPGLVAVGAPLLNFDGHVEAAISIYGPKSRLDEQRIQSVGILVRDAAMNISSRLGHRSAIKI